MTHDAPMSLETITAADFEPVRGQTFRLASPAGDLDLRLAEVQTIETAQRAGGGFSLTFAGAPGPYLPQAIYPLTNEKLGTLEIFLVPIGPTDGGNGYEAVFT